MAVEARSAPPLSERPAPVSSGPPLDPTARTLEQLQREISQTSQILEANGRGTREVLETRLSAGDKAIELLQRDTDMLPEQIRNAVEQLRLLHDERFRSLETQLMTHLSGIQTQFAERDKRMEQLSLADKTAIAAALQAQKEAAGAQNDSNATANSKMENNFVKLIEQTQQLLQAVSRSTDDKINDVKSRLDKGEGQTSVSDPATAQVMQMLLHEVKDLKSSDDRHAGRTSGSDKMVSTIVTIGSFVIAVISVLSLIVGKMHT